MICRSLPDLQVQVRSSFVKVDANGNQVWYNPDGDGTNAFLSHARIMAVGLEWLRSNLKKSFINRRSLKFSACKNNIVQRS
jgi:hypothetical protein